ncbi:hypothetical protein MUK42_27020 [Musa troglodytarum]|uniref:Uncharacterized protein n=1 Tax=Musa troglodytarum TaxID=320322 RepID=A0A9E7K0E0_9LILI|nr:hypothetical protein MUK42_27020 [Musa troglodytarum]
MLPTSQWRVSVDSQLPWSLVVGAIEEKRRPSHIVGGWSAGGAMTSASCTTEDRVAEFSESTCLGVEGTIGCDVFVGLSQRLALLLHSTTGELPAR